LSEGDSGDAVRELQQLLTKSGNYNGDIDGDFDALTGSAVRSFQQKTGLEVTGIVDDQTWSSLREAAELEPA
jgi:N-acetylmuramoyl-L-alanine amidase